MVDWKNRICCKSHPLNGSCQLSLVLYVISQVLHLFICCFFRNKLTTKSAWIWLSKSSAVVGSAQSLEFHGQRWALQIKVSQIVDGKWICLSVGSCRGQHCYVDSTVMFLVPWCHVAVKKTKAWKPSKLSLSAIMFWVFFNDRLLRTETGERKVDGSGWDDKTDCRRQEGKILEPRVRSQHQIYESLIKLHAGAAMEDSGHKSPDCR